MAEVRSCKQCGVEFVARYVRSAFCTKKCKNAWTNGRFDNTLYRYGISKSRVLEIVQEQGGCAICGSQDGPWVVDHDHACCPDLGRDGARARACGKCNRGVLCRPCNIALGLMQDDTDRLLAAAAYVMRQTNVLAFEVT